MKNKNLITNDIAIKHIDDDLLNYHPYAKKIQQVIQGYSNNPEPLTIGIYGKWGSGKTSLLNLIEKHIELFQKEKEDKLYIKFHYNPWVYQTKEEMLFDFFETLSRKLNYSGDENLKTAGKFIKKYSRYLKAVKLSASVGIPKVFNTGISIEPYEILQRLGEDLQGEEKSLDEIKKEVDSTLKLSNKKIIVFIDDIDRLDKDEIFTLFKLIKINADFKNLIFIICLDPEHVAKAIHHRYGDDKKSGKDFLEKIINIPIELPLIEEVDLDYFIKEKIKPILSLKLIKNENLEELFGSLKGNYFNSPREIIRIINSFAISLYAIGDEVNIHDLFWIEYIKIKHHKTYQIIKNYAKNFNSKQSLLYNLNFNDAYFRGEEVSGLRKKILEEHKDAYSIIRFLFPIKGELTEFGFHNSVVNPENILDAELRINHINHFEKYFSFHTQGKISELFFSNFKTEVVLGDSDKALNVLKNLISNADERKITYRIKSEIEVANKKLESKLISFLIDNIKEFSETSGVNSHAIEIIQTIADKLKQNPENNKTLVLTIIKNLDYNELCWFLGAFRNSPNINYIADIERVLIDKITTSDNHPFFKIKGISKMVMEIWSKLEHQKFQNYLLDNLNTQDNIFTFFMNFPNFWNGSINGIFKSDDYQYIKDVLKLDMKLIFNKINHVIPNLGDLEKLGVEKLKWNEYTSNSGLENTQQFAYWHLTSEEQNKIREGLPKEEEG